MHISQYLRCYLFWLLDVIKGSPIKKDISDIEKIVTGTTSDHLRKERLDRILYHASKTTDFYSDYNPSLGIKEFPILNKNIIRENFDNFISNKFEKSELIPVVTSGSTGTPFKVFHDRRKKIRNSADTLFFAGLAGFRPGHRLIYLKIWAKEKMLSDFHYWQQNMVPVDVIHLNNQQIQSIIESMERVKGTYGILGYVSALELVCRYLDQINKEKVKASVQSILTMSESLNDYVRTKMEYYFGCKVYSRYSNLENGIIAQQVPGSNGRFLINSASYYVEIFKLNENTLAEPGETGRIVVTDLFNWAMPLIRYDTGDIGSVVCDENGKMYFESIEGRKLDVLYDTSGNIVSSYIMYKNMWKYTDIKQYQLIQKDKKRYEFKINAEPSFSQAEQLTNEFLSYLGSDAEFTISYVDEIPLLDSGKRRKLVNEMIQPNK